MNSVQDVAKAVPHQMDLVDEAATRRLGQQLAELLRGGAVVYLEGPLGAGKSTLARAIIHALGHPGAVPSPTYSIAEAYQLEGLRVLHLDLYRIADPEELEYLGVLDDLKQRVLLLVEWPERGRGGIPDPDLVIELAYLPGTNPLDQRRALIQARSPRGLSLLEKNQQN